MIKRLKSFLIKISSAINAVINFILLSVVYIIGVGLTSITAKLFRKSFLDTKIPKKKTYWSGLDLKKRPIEKYYRQF